MPSTPLPRRFRSFSLRRLMVLFTLACVGAAWLAREWSGIRLRRKTEEIVKRYDGALILTAPKETSWLRQLLGDRKYVPNYISMPKSSRPSDSELEEIRHAFPEANMIDNDSEFERRDGEEPRPKAPLHLHQPPDEGLAHKNPWPTRR